MEEALLELIRSIARGEADGVSRALAAAPELATQASAVGATREDPTSFRLVEIERYLYAGDTALHVAAAAFQKEMVLELLRYGACCAARNRRGAGPLHYAAETNHWNPSAQADTITCLIDAGADVNAGDAGAVTPLHRAVRTRSASAVHALLVGGADPRQKSRSGSTPLHLAVQSTGRGGTGSPRAIEQQGEILCLLLESGARPTDRDAKGRVPAEAARDAWVRSLLDAHR